ncbi:hypothetical protein QBC47DRAFT_459897 [Echria macrotheca]|uniref:Uncharacterized protein n=1 Tax=Echria macrotheca TaxID=438768 RepID=A0AAJ0BI47_9PEZI|nr:hypothetical protein QBC47DRAFT_459897 [Echria macrotheca]
MAQKNQNCRPPTLSHLNPRAYGIRGDKLAEHKKYFARTDNNGHQFRTTLEEVIYLNGRRRRTAIRHDGHYIRTRSGSQPAGIQDGDEADRYPTYLVPAHHIRHDKQMRGGRKGEQRGNAVEEQDIKREQETGTE